MQVSGPAFVLVPSRTRAALLLGGVVALLTISPSLVWIMLDTSAWGGDQTQYGRAAIELYRTLAETPGQWVSRLLDVFPSKPNGLIWAGQFFVPLGLAIGSIDVALLLAVAMVQAVTLVVMYRAIWEVTPGNNRLIPLAGCLALGSAPLFVEFTHRFLVETLQTLSVAWFILIVACAPRWSRGSTLAQLAGATVLAMSSKEIQFLFCAWPGLFAVYYLIRPRPAAPRALSASLIVTVVATVVAGIATAAWYYRNLDAVVMHVQAGAYGPGVRTFWGKEDTYPNTVAYWLTTLGEALFAPGMLVGGLVLLAAVVLYLPARARPETRHFTRCAAIAGLQIVTVVLVFSLSPVRIPRYILPALPYCALLLAWSLSRIDRLAATRLALLALVAQLGMVHAHALHLTSWRVARVRAFDRNAENSRVLDSIVARTCPGSGPGSYFNVLAIDTAVQVLPGGNWLGAEQANYVAAKHALERGESPRCHYGYPGDDFFGSRVPKAWESMLSRRAAFFITIDPAVYRVPARVFNEALRRENFPLMLEKVRTSGVFEAELPLAGYPGVLLFHRIDYVARGRALSDQGRHDEAVAELRKAADLEPTNVEAWANLNLAYSRQGRDQEGIGAGYRGLDLDADHYWLNIVTAEMLERRAQWSEVTRLGRRALERAPDPEQRARVSRLLARASARTGEASSARRP